mmetsp:Transcript_2572/g.10772  ORF Transcript_2572/g.10772 Transcript_2572/m.10772 type:complete len:218 (+) Transcript_2572:1992-2645(+)
MEAIVASKLALSFSSWSALDSRSDSRRLIFSSLSTFCFFSWATSVDRRCESSVSVSMREAASDPFSACAAFSDAIASSFTSKSARSELNCASYSVLRLCWASSAWSFFRAISSSAVLAASASFSYRARRSVASSLGRESLSDAISVSFALTSVRRASSCVRRSSGGAADVFGWLLASSSSHCTSAKRCPSASPACSASLSLCSSFSARSSASVAFPW